MGMHELNALIAHFSRDPDNEEAMARARWYAALREAMFPTETTDESESAA